MRISEAVKKIGGVSNETLRDWLRNPNFEQFFSEDARGVNRAHRDIHPDDLLVLNTIYHLRYRDENAVTDWSEIAKVLEGGFRYNGFAGEVADTGMFTVPMDKAEQSARAAATMKERDMLVKRVDELETTINRLQQEKEAIRKDLTDEIISLHRQIARLETLLEVERDKNKDADED